jgi:hypothetical protein
MRWSVRHACERPRGTPISVAETAGAFTCLRFYRGAMAGAVDHPDIRFVVDPVHMDGTLTGAKPRMRHRPGCRHFKWPNGKALGTPVLATEAQMRSLRPCKSCVASRGSARGETPPKHERAQRWGPCAGCNQPWMSWQRRIPSLASRKRCWTATGIGRSMPAPPAFAADLRLVPLGRQHDRR